MFSQPLNLCRLGFDAIVYGVIITTSASVIPASASSLMVCQLLDKSCAFFSHLCNALETFI